MPRTSRTPRVSAPPAAAPTVRLPWRTDAGEIAPMQRQLGVYALRLFAAYPDLALRLADRDFLVASWSLLLPLLKPSALERLGFGRPVDSEDDDDPFCFMNEELPISVRRTVLGPHRGLLERWLTDQLSAVDAAVIHPLVTAEDCTPSNPVIALLARTLALSDVEAQVLDFAHKIVTQPVFEIFLREGQMVLATRELFAIAAMLDVPDRALRDAVAHTATLQQLRLIKRKENFRAGLEDCVLPTPMLGDLVAQAPDSEEALLRTLIDPAPPSTLALSDFPHLARSAKRMTKVVRAALDTSTAGVNALLYGPPGTGKTEFALALAQAVGVQAYCVSTADTDDEELDRSKRLMAYLLAQKILAKRANAVLIFDEVEDVFGDQSGPLRALFGIKTAAAQGSKGWMNRALEENAVPTIWITNDADSMDKAYLRRFLLPQEFRAPSRELRRQMAARHLAEAGLPDTALAGFCDDTELVPAELANAARLLQLQPDADPQEELRASLAATGRLLRGHPPRRRQPALAFDVAYLNVAGRTPPARVAEALLRHGEGRLLFAGPPGTGKTEFAHMLAQALDRELVAAQASDILGRYVGDTERALANLFSQHDPDTTILLIDEVDSLLRDRSQSVRSWETTQVNELLQQMERYPGVFIAATNHLDNLDPAAMRRFDFKLEFHPLTQEQRLRLFARESLGDESQAHALAHTVRAHLAQLTTLTPGDFAVAVRQCRLLDEAPSPERLIRILIGEAAWRSDGQGGPKKSPQVAALKH